MKKLHDIKLQTIINKKDFLTSFYSTFQMTEAVDDNVGDNQYYFNDTTGIMSVRNLGSKSNYYRLFFNNLSRGDIVEVEYEGMNVSSATGIQVQLQETTARGASGALVYAHRTNVKQNSTFEKHRFEYIHQKQNHNNVYVCVGLFADQSGHIKLRNVKARVKSATGVGSSKSIDAIKKAEIIKNSSGWSKRNDFVGESVTMSELDVNTLKVTYETPFVGNRPIVIVNQDWFSSSYKYIARASNSTITDFQIKFYDSSGVVVPLASLSNDIFLGFMAIGEKNYFDV